jgi:hypothetical protein
MAKYRANCTVCIAAKKDPALRKRIKFAAFKREPGDETLLDLGREFKLTTASMYNHAKKHISDDSEVIARRHDVITANKVVKLKAQVQEDLELQLDLDTVDDIDSDPGQIAALKEYITQGHDLIKKGKLNITAQSFLVAVRTLNEYEAKKTNNKIEFLRTISSFRGGAKKAAKQPIEGEIVHGNRPTDQVTGSAGEGTNESSSLHRRAFGHAPAPRTGELSEQDAKATG